MNFSKAEFETSFGTFEQLPASDLPEIVFAGRSNVGKSSLINKIFNRKSLARISSVPGKTVTINFYKMEKARLVDLPGYGFAKVSGSEKKRWNSLMEGYFTSDRELALVIQLIDIRHAPSADDLTMIRYLIEGEFPFIIAFTKADKLSPAQKTKRLEDLKGEIPDSENIISVPVSVQSGEGVERLKELITEAVAACYEDMESKGQD